MTLHAIVAALGGDLYAAGMRANVPAPGHSARDRSVSLLLCGDRLVLHSFGDADWRAVRDHLRARGLIDGTGRIAAGAGGGRRSAAVRPERAARVATARRLWAEAGAIGAAALSRRYIAARAIGLEPAAVPSLRHHPAAPVSAYGTGGATRPALVAAIRRPDGTLTAVELVYLSPNGRPDDRLRLPRKTVGVVPPGSAVRLAAGAPVLLVGEGVMTVLSASERFGLPAWALMSAHNLAAWTPPSVVRRVVIAADRGAPGEAAARRLLDRLGDRGVDRIVVLPPGGAEDWNAAALAERRKEGG